jgi:poly(hydroxyalkanoate) depolymerase family esterase
MKVFPMIDMMEVTRLTREGQLKEAMAILRGASTGVHRPNEDRDARHGAGESPTTTLDMMQPGMGTDGAWTLPKFTEATFARRREGDQLAQTPESLRGLFDRIGQIATMRGLEGVVRPPLAPVPDGARFEGRTYANAAGTRAYKLYVPSGYVEQAVPLVVMLHGCKQSPDDFAAGTRMNELAEDHTFLVGYPAQSHSANVSKCWNWFKAGDQQRDRGEPSLIAGITREILRDFRVERGNVCVAGLSAGGAAAAIMGSTYPDLFAAVGVHSGLACGVASDISSAFTAMRTGARAEIRRHTPGVRTIAFHGDRDMVVNSVNGDQVISQAKDARGLHPIVSHGQSAGDVRYTRTVHADESGREMFEHWLVHGLGHAWSGGSPAGSYTEPLGPDASREMVRFFLRASGMRSTSSD